MADLLRGVGTLRRAWPITLVPSWARTHVEAESHNRNLGMGPWDFKNIHPCAKRKSSNWCNSKKPWTYIKKSGNWCILYHSKKNIDKVLLHENILFKY